MIKFTALLILSLMILLPATCHLCAEDEPRRTFGWRSDDGSKPVRMMAPRDWPIKTPAASSDLTPLAVKPLDQGQLGSCVGHGTALAWTMAHYRDTGRHLPLSRLMIYYNARLKIGMAHADEGCQIIDAVDSLVEGGAAREKLWPYKINRFALTPPAAAYSDGLAHRVVRRYKVDNSDGKSIRLALTNKHAVVFGSLVYSGMDRVTRWKPVLEMPRKGERWTGRHCMVIIGHDDAKRLYRVQNSWGRFWGDGGRFWMPYDYIHSPRLTEDCHIIELVMLTP